MRSWLPSTSSSTSSSRSTSISGKSPISWRICAVWALSYAISTICRSASSSRLGSSGWSLAGILDASFLGGSSPASSSATAKAASYEGVPLAAAAACMMRWCDLLYLARRTSWWASTIRPASRGPFGCMSTATCGTGMRWWPYARVLTLSTIYLLSSYAHRPLFSVAKV